MEHWQITPSVAKQGFFIPFFFFFFFSFLQAVTAFGSNLEWTRKKGDRASGSQLAREDGLSIQLPDEVRIKSHHTSSSALSIPELPVVSHNWFTSWLFLPSTALTSFLRLSSLSPAVYLHLSVFISLVAAMKNVMKQSSLFFFFWQSMCLGLFILLSAEKHTPVSGW